MSDFFWNPNGNTNDPNAVVKKTHDHIVYILSSSYQLQVFLFSALSSFLRVFPAAALQPLHLPTRQADRTGVFLCAESQCLLYQNLSVSHNACLQFTL